MYIKNIVYCFFFIFIYSCIPYKSYQKNDAICEVGMELKDYEKIFDKKLNIIEGKWQNIDSGNFTLYYIKYVDKDGFFLTKRRKVDNVEKSIKYNEMGNIEYVFYKYNRVYLGTSYFFDTLGNVTKIVDDRQADKYPICFREALEIVKSKTPKRYIINAIERDSMIIDSQKIYHWEISTRDPKKYYSYHYSINAQTGKVIKKGISRVVYDSPD